ncbi:pyridoxal phosphate-dependent aminotransferase [Croceicoccus sp. F390]|uniref:Aminotransferase n=1 Tax=Croceicoccus esteveae TaxID=3075597 RepID=A0ABU2ZK17_9SPHN|nr:pyridoxal phosphate-dependent aminotransferase [Croceicoccus sp. F390]MDT0576721.1 pyridoxal phosphate-dependent aminotransferase [Croceicoccus sp. F390]
MNPPLLSTAIGRIAPSPTAAMTDRATQLRQAGRDVVSLSVGEPDLATPAHVVAAVKQALDQGQTNYTPVGGTAAMKRAAMLHFRRDLGIATGYDNVTVSAGGKQAIFHALMATLDPGDEVLIPAPWWVSYPEIVAFAGGRVVPMRTGAQDGFRIDPEQLARAITPRSRWLLLNSPANPTGAVYSTQDLSMLAKIIEDHPRLLVMSDDIYAPWRYDEMPHATLAALRPDLADRILTVSGVSKSHAMTGFRIGVAAGPEWLIRAMESLQSHSSGNPCSISQAGAVAAFEGSQDFLREWRDIYHRRRDRVVQQVNATDGLATPAPAGAFYCLVDAALHVGAGRRWSDDQALALHLLDHGVAVVPASAFGAAHCGLSGFRISFAADEALMDEALARIASALEQP